jgi:hypothetical protein
MGTYINVALNIGSHDGIGIGIVTNMPQYTTRVKVVSFFTENEIQISECLQQIPHWQLYYDCIAEHEAMNIHLFQVSLKKNTFGSLISKSEEGVFVPVVCKYLQYKSVDFDEFFLSLPSPKLVVFHAIDSYSHLLNSFNRLEQVGVCYYNFSPEYLSFDEYYKPRITNFDKSIQTGKINEQFLVSLIRGTKDFTHKPLEVHLLFYLIANNIDLLTDDLIMIICDTFIENLAILGLFSQQYKELHKNECLSFLGRYLNKGRTEIIADVLKYIDTWDNYGLSMLYLHLIGNIASAFSLKGTIMSKLIALFTKNISPTPETRNTLQNTILIYKKLYCDFNDWSFVEQIQEEAIDVLHEKLRY